MTRDQTGTAERGGRKSPVARRIKYFLMGGVSLAFGLWMIVVRESPFNESAREGLERARSQSMAEMLDWIWSLPAGIVLGLLGLLLLWCAFAPDKKPSSLPSSGSGA